MMAFVKRKLEKLQKRTDWSYLNNCNIYYLTSIYSQLFVLDKYLLMMLLMIKLQESVSVILIILFSVYRRSKSIDLKIKKA